MIISKLFTLSIQLEDSIDTDKSKELTINFQIILQLRLQCCRLNTIFTMKTHLGAIFLEEIATDKNCQDYEDPLFTHYITSTVVCFEEQIPVHKIF